MVGPHGSTLGQFRSVGARCILGKSGGSGETGLIVLFEQGEQVADTSYVIPFHQQAPQCQHGRGADRMLAEQIEIAFQRVPVGPVDFDQAGEFQSAQRMIAASAFD